MSGVMCFVYMYVFILDDSKPELKDFNKFLTEYANLWKDIGLELGIKPAVLSLVESSHFKDDRECLRATLQKWLQMNTGVTWKNLELAITNTTRAKLGLEPLQASKE